MADDKTEFLGKAVNRLSAECEGFSKVEKEIELLEDQLAKLRKYKDDKASELADSFLAAGIQNTRYNGRTYYLHTTRAVRKTTGVSQEEACEALRVAGMDCYIKEQYSPQQVRAHLAEIHEELEPGTPFEEALPPSMKGLFYVFEKASLRSRA